MLQWTLDAVSSSDRIGEMLAFGAVALSISYAYVWAAILALTALAGLRRGRTETPWVHVWVNSIGGLTMAALGVLLLGLRDPWLPLQVRWIAAVLPMVILAPMWAAARFVSACRRTWAVVAIAILPQVPLQLVLARVSVSRGGQPWGFAAGSIGALLALAGSVFLAWRRDRPTGPDRASDGGGESGR
jgi:hypothetical protein